MCSVAAENDSEGVSTSVTTSNLDSSTFVLEANQVDGIALKLSSRVGVPLGTASVTLRNSTTSTNVATVTVNATDFDSNSNGWYVFPLGLNHTPNGTDSYLIRVTASVTAQVSFYCLAGNNWTRQVRRTATQAPAVNDKLLAYGEHTGAGTGNSFTITNDNTATTSFGPTVSGGPPQGMSIGKRCTFTFATNIAAYLKVKGILAVYGGGTLNIGASGARIGASSSAILEFDSVANVDSGWVNFPGGTINGGGDTSRVTNTLMTADKAAAATVIAVASTAGWQVGDELAFASTTRTAADCEKKTVLTVDSATQVTLSAGLTNAHSGTSPTQAEVINLTRNVKIRGVSASLQGYCQFQTTSTVNIDYCEFTQLGSATSNKRGIDIQTTTGTCSITNCSSHDSSVTGSQGFLLTGTSGTTTSTLIISNNVTYALDNSSFTTTTTTGTWLANSNVFTRNTAAGANLVNLADVGGTFTNNTMVGATSSGLSIAESGGTLGTMTGNTSHSNGSRGIIFATATNGGTIDGFTIWRNAGTGITFTGSLGGVTGMTWRNMTLFGNTGTNLEFATAVQLTIDSMVCAGDTTFSTTNGVSTNGTGHLQQITFINCTFGVASGILTAHSADFTVGGSTSGVLWQFTLNNCLSASATEVSSQANLQPGSYIRSQKHDQTAGNHKAFYKYGTVSIDTAIYDAANPSARLAPNNASSKLAIDGGAVDQNGCHFVSVASGGTITVTVRVRKSVVGDGTAYNGNQPRLILKKNVAAGVTVDTVLATAAAAAGNWETLTGTTSAVTDDAVLSFAVDCDGTTGWVNVDNWTDSGGSDPRGLQFWADGAPFSSSAFTFRSQLLQPNTWAFME